LVVAVYVAHKTVFKRQGLSKEKLNLPGGESLMKLGR